MLSTNNVTPNTTLHVFDLPFNISIDKIKNEIMACMAQSLGQQVETRSHDSSARLKIKCIMYTGSRSTIWQRNIRKR